MARDGRSGADWNRARQWVLASYESCWICHELVDFDAPPRSPRSPSVDHAFPVSLMRGWDPEDRRQLTIDRENLRLAHYGCNSSRGNRPRRELAVEVGGSREW